jgi:hypothetical protein
VILRYFCAILTKIRVRQQILAELPNFNFVEKKNLFRVSSYSDGRRYRSTYNFFFLTFRLQIVKKFPPLSEIEP